MMRLFWLAVLCLGVLELVEVEVPSGSGARVAVGRVNSGGAYDFAEALWVVTEKGRVVLVPGDEVRLGGRQ